MMTPLMIPGRRTGHRYRRLTRLKAQRKVNVTPYAEAGKDYNGNGSADGGGSRIRASTGEKMTGSVRRSSVTFR